MGSGRCWGSVITLTTALTTTYLNPRYDGQRAVLGDKLHSQLTELRGFVVGAGAIGCEVRTGVGLGLANSVETRVRRRVG